MSETVTVRDRIKLALRGMGRPMSVRAIAMRLGYSNSNGHLRDELEEMAESGEVERCNGCPSCGTGRRYKTTER